MKKSIAIVLALLAVSAAAFAGGKKDKVTITKPSDLDGLRLGCQVATTGELYIQEEVKNAQIRSFRTGMDAALDLKNGGIDAIVIDELPAKAIVANNPDLTIVDLDLATEEYAIAVRKGNSELLNSINRTIREMRSNGDYENLVNAFMPADGDIKIPATIPTIGTAIRVGLNAAFPPFEYVEGTKVVGFDITMSEYIARDYGRQLEIVDMSFDGLIAALQSGAIDFIASGMTATDERRQNVDFSDAYFSSKQVIIVRK